LPIEHCRADPFFAERAARSYRGPISKLADKLAELRELFLAGLKYVADKGDKYFAEVAAKELVDMYGYLFVGYLLLADAEQDDRKVFVANRYIISALARARRNLDAIVAEQFSDLLHADRILV